jgi:LemA protein
VTVATLIAVAASIVAVVVFVWLTYNRMISRRNAVDNSWSQLDVELKRRHDLIPALVDAVGGYAQHERRTFERVTETRTAAKSASGPPSRAVAEGALTDALGRLLVLAEDYPQLEASDNFSKLQDDLGDTENRIAIARRVYNDTVESFNTLVQIFPAVFVARAFGFTPREFFDAPDQVEVAPEARFSSFAQAGTAAE